MQKSQLEEFFQVEEGVYGRSPRSVEEAIARGEDSFVEFTLGSPVCPNGAHIRNINIHSRQCSGCGPLRQSPSARAAARRRGDKHYLSRCDHHGANTSHSVAHGKCLLCFTSMGLVRARKGAVWTFDRGELDLAKREDVERLLEWAKAGEVCLVN